MARQFSTSIDIAAPPATVWAVMSDVERWHEWTASIRSVTRLDEGPMRVGSRTKVRQPRLPVAFWTVSDWQPGQGFSWVNRSPGLRVTGKHSVAPIACGTRATLGLDVEGVFGPVLAWLTGGITERYIAMEAAGLKARSEELATRG